MKRSLQQILLPGIFLGLLLLGTGCYTQLGTTRDQNQEEYTSVESDTTGDTYEQTYTRGSYDDENFAPGYRYGFDYYYPTLAFSFSTYDPWYWRYSGWYCYDPFRCGTYYPAIYAGWHYWYPPVFYNYPHYGYHNYATAGGRGFRGTTRTIGSTRGGGTVRASGGRNEVGSRGGSSGAADLPTGYRSASGTRSNPPANTPRVSSGRSSGRSGDSGSRSGTRGNSGVRGGNSRGASREGTRTETPRTYTPPPRDRGSDRGSTGRSYSPPPPPPPAQSPPPSSGGRSGGSSGSSGGTRGGRNR